MKNLRSSGILAAFAHLLVLYPFVSAAQTIGPPPPLAPRLPAREAALIDLTGQWVSIVTEDWRFRMVTPRRGDYPGVFLTPAGEAIASAWDPTTDEADGNQCKSYGAAAIMRVPGRLRITWADDWTLRIETDAGQQTRLLHFGPVENPPAATWQGISRAEWVPHTAESAPRKASLKVVTKHMKEGYLRKNGVPYSADAVMTEYFDLLEEPDGSRWLIVKSIVEDPTYFSATPIITSSNFRRQNDRSGWDPQPCSSR